jgi:hypothetical protein
MRLALYWPELAAPLIDPMSTLHKCDPPDAGALPPLDPRQLMAAPGKLRQGIDLRQ